MMRLSCHSATNFGQPTTRRAPWGLVGLPKAAASGRTSMAWSVCVHTPVWRSSRWNRRCLCSQCCFFCEVVPVTGFKQNNTLFPLQHAWRNRIKRSPKTKSYACACNLTLFIRYLLRTAGFARRNSVFDREVFPTSILKKGHIQLWKYEGKQWKSC